MTQEQKEILNKYANAKVTIAEATDTVDELAEAVMKIVEEFAGGEKGDTVLVEDGKYVVKEGKRKYVYPSEVLEKEAKLKEEIKEVKTISEQKGDGTYETKVGLTFYRNK